MAKKCSVCEKEGVLYWVGLVGQDQPLCATCLEKVGDTVRRAVKRMRDEHLLAVVAGEGHNEKRESPLDWLKGA